MYNQYNKNKMDGLLIWRKPEQGLRFYIPIGAIFVEPEGCPPDTKENHEGELALVVVMPQ